MKKVKFYKTETWTHDGLGSGKTPDDLGDFSTVG